MSAKLSEFQQLAWAQLGVGLRREGGVPAIRLLTWISARASTTRSQLTSLQTLCSDEYIPSTVFWVNWLDSPRISSNADRNLAAIAPSQYTTSTIQ